MSSGLQQQRRTVAVLSMVWCVTMDGLINVASQTWPHQHGLTNMASTAVGGRLVLGREMRAFNNIAWHRNNAQDKIGRSSRSGPEVNYVRQSSDCTLLMLLYDSLCLFDSSCSLAQSCPHIFRMRIPLRRWSARRPSLHHHFSFYSIARATLSR